MSWDKADGIISVQESRGSALILVYWRPDLHFNDNQDMRHLCGEASMARLGPKRGVRGENCNCRVQDGAGAYGSMSCNVQGWLLPGPESCRTFLGSTVDCSGRLDHQSRSYCGKHQVVSRESCCELVQRRHHLWST